MLSRRFLRILFGVLLSLSLIAVLMSYSFVQITKPEIAKQIFTEAVAQQTNNTYNQIYQACQNNNFQGSLNVEVRNQTIALNCSEIHTGGKNAFVATISGQVFNSVYSKHYDCSVIQCIASGQVENFLVIFSAEGNSYFNLVLLFSFIAVLIFGFIHFYFYDNWIGRYKGIGKTLLWIGVPFLIFIFLSGPIIQLFLPQEISQFSSLISSQLETTTLIIFLIIAVGGVISYTVGFVLQRRKKLLPRA